MRSAELPGALGLSVYQILVFRSIAIEAKGSCRRVIVDRVKARLAAAGIPVDDSL